MPSLDRKLIRDRYFHEYGADVAPAFGTYLEHEGTDGTLATLGYSRAGTDPLFLERYLDEPVERAVATAFGEAVARDQIVEIGNLASCNGWALVRLWGLAANDLGGELEFAVATLTAPLRAMFRRIGLPVQVLAAARVERSGGGDWGSYYQLDPQVCVGRIAEGQRAIACFLARRQRERAA